MDIAGISLLYIYSTSFTNNILYNNLLYNAEIWNKRLESFCIVVGGIRETKMMRALNWSGECSWGSDHLYITIYSINISPCVDSQFSVVVKECDDSFHLGRNEWFDFIALWQRLHLLEDKFCSGYSLSREDKLLLKYDNSAMKIFNFFPLFNTRVARSDQTSPFIPQRWGAYEWIILDIIFHTEILRAWVFTTL